MNRKKSLFLIHNRRFGAKVTTKNRKVTSIGGRSSSCGEPHPRSNPRTRCTETRNGKKKSPIPENENKNAVLPVFSTAFPGSGKSLVFRVVLSCFVVLDQVDRASSFTGFFFVFGRQFYRVIFCRYPRKSPAGACGRREVEKKKRTSTPRGLFCFFSLAPRRPPAEEEQAVEEEEGRRHERGESFELMARSSSRSAAQWNVDVHSLRPPRQKTRGVGAV